jgi:hypothetical protein
MPHAFVGTSKTPHPESPRRGAGIVARGASVTNHPWYGFPWNPRTPGRGARILPKRLPVVMLAALANHRLSSCRPSGAENLCGITPEGCE